MNKKGVSLIVLMITIIVIIILSAVMIMSLNSTNIFGNSDETVFKSDANSYKYELESFLQNAFLSDVFSEKEDINVEADNEDIKKYIPSIKDSDIGKFKIFEGELIFVGKNEKEKEWAKEIGIRIDDNLDLSIASFSQVGGSGNSITLETVMKYESKNYKFEYELLDENKKVISKAEKKELNRTKVNTYSFSNLQSLVNSIKYAKVTVRNYDKEAIEKIIDVTINTFAPAFEFNEAWAKKVDVTVKVKEPKSGYKLKIITPDRSETITEMNTLSEYFTKTVEVNQNGNISAFILDSSGKEINSGSVEIGCIDNEGPTKPEIELISAANGIIKVEAKNSVDTGVSADSESGTIKYKYSLDYTNWQDTGTFTNLVVGKTYKVYAKALDALENESEISLFEATLPKFDQVEISATPTAWTKSDVTVRMSYDTISGYVLQYSYDLNNWYTYTNALTVTKNQLIYGRIYNSTNNDTGNSENSYNITNIDKTAPTKPSDITVSTSLNSLTAKATGSKDSQSGFGKYKYSIDQVNWNDTGIFTGLSSGTQYTVYAKAVDNVGNESSSNSVVTKTLASLNVAFSGTGYQNEKQSTSCSISADGQYTISGPYSYSYDKYGTLTITNIPQGAIISYVIQAPDYVSSYGDTSSTSDPYSTPVSKSSASINFAGTRIATGSTSLQSGTYTTTTSGSLTCSVSSSYSGCTAKVSITNIKYNGIDYTFTYSN